MRLPCFVFFWPIFAPPCLLTEGLNVSLELLREASGLETFFPPLLLFLLLLLTRRSRDAAT